MENWKQKAKQFLYEFKGNNYLFSTALEDRIRDYNKTMESNTPLKAPGRLETPPTLAALLASEIAPLGKKVSLVANHTAQSHTSSQLAELRQSLLACGMEVNQEYIAGAKPNAPREDVIRIATRIHDHHPDIVLSLGGGSTTDAVKAAIAYATLKDCYPDLSAYFGSGEISRKLAMEKRTLIPHVAVMTAAGSAAHLTKYANVTDEETGQKMLMVDDALIPVKAAFDYSATLTQPLSLTVDGALDGISHALEVLMGVPEHLLEKARPVCLLAIELIVTHLKRAVRLPSDPAAREAIALGTDLGGYAIMIGGTNGAHLNSFSLTDILSHGRACALMNPYYVVFFSAVVADRLKEVARIYKRAGYMQEDPEKLTGTALGTALADGMMRLSEDIGFPTTLRAVPGYTETHKKKCLEAAKDPQLQSKLQNMPVPLLPTQIDKYMGAILNAAETGKLEKIEYFPPC